MNVLSGAALVLADAAQGFVRSFHLPSVIPGDTPSVRSDADLARFIAKCRRHFEFFVEQLRSRAITPLQLKAHLAEHGQKPVAN